MRKAIITSVSILCLMALFFCGCGKKNDKGNSESANTSGTSSQASGTDSQVSMTEGVDEISVSNIEDNAIEIDFETGSVISVPSNKNNSSSSSKPNGTLGDPSTSSSSSTDSSSNASSSSSSSSEVSSAESGGDESRDTNSGFSPWQ